MRTRLTIALLVLVLAPMALAQKSPLDPTEYSAYYTADNQPTPPARANALEQFLRTYPNSVMKEDALESLMHAYQQSKNDAMVQDAAQRLLAVNPDELSALAVLCYHDYLEGQRTYNQEVLGRAAKNAQKGLQVLRTAQQPDGIPNEDWDKQRKTWLKIFQNAIGMNAFVARNYPEAQHALSVVVAYQPDDLPSVFLLAETELEQEPFAPDGLFWGARAVGLARKSGSGADQIQKYVKYKFVQARGSETGFEDLVTASSGPGAMPPGFQLADADKLPDKPVAKPVEKKESPNALGEEDVLNLLKNNVSPQRVTSLVIKMGVKFDLTAATEARLRNAGADDRLIQTIQQQRR